VTATVATVLGDVPAGRLGPTLVHEHLYADMTGMLGAHGYDVAADEPLDPALAAEARWHPGSFPDNYRLTDLDLTIRELEPLVQAGCRTVVDATPVGLGRSPEALAALARATGLNVVMGCGWYLEPVHPAGLSARTVDDLAAELVRELRDGVGETGVRPGLIGELGTSAVPTDAERRVLRAAAAAQRETGVCVSVHLHPWSKNGLAVLDLLEGEGVDPRRVVLNHLTTAIDDEQYQLALLERGAFACYDLFGFDHSCLGPGRYVPSDHDAAARVAALAERGHLGQLLVSQDVGVKTRLRAFGGWGYAHLFEHVVPLLRANGLDDATLDVLLVENPRRALAACSAAS
jgi:phosphotriesterase-related protein